jgi:hypothetical protein
MGFNDTICHPICKDFDFFFFLIQSIKLKRIYILIEYNFHKVQIFNNFIVQTASNLNIKYVRNNHTPSRIVAVVPIQVR